MPRWVAAAIDGVLMILGAIYIVLFADATSSATFEGFLITLGVPIAAWCGVFLADLALRAPRLRRGGAVRPRTGATARSAGSVLIVMVVSAPSSAGGWSSTPPVPEAPRLARLLPRRHHRRHRELPPHVVRPRRHGRRLGLRQPRRTAGARHRLRGLPRLRLRRRTPSGAGAARPRDHHRHRRRQRLRPSLDRLPRVVRLYRVLEHLLRRTTAQVPRHGGPPAPAGPDRKGPRSPPRSWCRRRGRCGRRSRPAGVSSRVRIDSTIRSPSL